MFFDVILLFFYLVLGRHLGGRPLDAGSSLLALLGDVGSTLLLVSQSEHTSILSSLLSGLLSSSALDGLQVPLVLEGTGSHKTLDLGDLVVSLAVLLEGSADGGLGDGVALLQIEELLDLGSSLGPQPHGVDDVSQTREVLLSLLDNGDV